jgi:hypothetical protein
MIVHNTLGNNFYRVDTDGERCIWFIYDTPIAYRGKAGKLRASENIHGQGFEKHYHRLADSLYRMDRKNFELCLEDEFGE